MLVSNSIAEVKDYLITLLTRALPDAHIVDGYYTGEFSGQVKNPTICVRLSKVSAKGDALSSVISDSDDANSSVETIGESVKLGFTFYIFAPISFSESDCNKIFIALCEILLFDEQYAFSDIESNEVHFDEDTQAFIGKVTADLSIIYTYVKHYERISDYSINTELK